MGEFQTGDLLSERWELGALLGRGAMGEVFRGTDRMLSRRVAIKLLAPHLVGDPTMLARFRREARAVARLSHPAIARLLEDAILLAESELDGPRQVAGQVISKID